MRQRAEAVATIVSKYIHKIRRTADQTAQLFSYLEDYVLEEVICHQEVGSSEISVDGSYWWKN
jgi:hypothetical protein